MVDSVKLFMWEGGALYIGPLLDNSEHRHHAVQVCLGLDGSFRLFRNGEWSEERFAALAANESHCLDSKGHTVAIALLDGESASGCLSTQELKAPDLADLQLPSNCEEARRFTEALVAPTQIHAHQRDIRIARALAHISTLETKRVTAAELADVACLSESRFMHLWREEVGLPLRRFLLWRRVMDTISAIVQGSDLTEAAHLGGFSDSAHFSRTFRETFGLSPSKLLRNSRFVQVSIEHIT